MKKFALIAPVALLVACSPSEPAPDAAEETAAPTQADLGLEIDGKPNVGTYEITEADGSVGTYVAAADGTYTYTLGDKVTKGTWSSSAPGKWCDQPEGADSPACFTESISADGVWSSVNDADPTQTSTIKRIE